LQDRAKETRRRVSRGRLRIACSPPLLLCLGCLLVTWHASVPARLRADAPDAALRANGLGPDVQLVGGGGLGLGGTLSNPFLGRARLGALYALAPWIANVGVTFDVGALGKLGFGCEFELNAWRGYFVDLGIAGVDDKQWMGHVSLGYTIFGIEWQHRFSDSTPSHALLLEVRLPLGVWWRLIGRKSDERSVAHARQTEPRPLGPTQPLAAAPKPASDASQRSAPSPVVAEPVARSEADRAQVAQALAEAERVTQHGDHAAAAAALQRAYILQADSLILLRLAEAELAQGRLLLASNDFRRFLATARTSQAQQKKAAAQSQLEAIARRLAHLRIELIGAVGNEQIELDGVVEPTALLGYDVALEPGEHSLSVLRDGARLAQRTVQAAETELLRISIDLASPAEPSSP
jgi:hypothetical protein